MNEIESQLVWRKSTRCGSGACVEVALVGTFSLVRDSKDPEGPVLTFSLPVWRGFIADLQAGDFDAVRP